MAKHFHPGSGRKYKYGEPTKTVRVPESLVDACHKWILDKLKRRKLGYDD